MPTKVALLPLAGTRYFSEVTIVCDQLAQETISVLREYLPGQCLDIDVTDGAGSRSSNFFVNCSFVESSSDQIRNYCGPISKHSIFEPFPGNKFYFKKEKNLAPRVLVNMTFDECYVVDQWGDTNDIRLPKQIKVHFDPKIHGANFKSSRLLRIFRDIQYSLMIAKGWTLMHCAVVERDGNAVAFFGNKGSGKTHSMLHCLEAGWNYLCNDRCYMNLDTLDAVTMPIAIMISKSATMPITVQRIVRENSLSRKDHLIQNYTKIGITPAELSGAMRVDVKLAAKIRHMVWFYEKQDGRTKQSDESLFRSNIYSPADPTYKFGAFSRKTNRVTIPDISLTCRRLAKLSNTTFYEARAKPTAEILERIAYQQSHS
jgi:hypothetical protein